MMIAEVVGPNGWDTVRPPLAGPIGAGGSA